MYILCSENSTVPVKLRKKRKAYALIMGAFRYNQKQPDAPVKVASICCCSTYKKVSVSAGQKFSGMTPLALTPSSDGHLDKCCMSRPSCKSFLETLPTGNVASQTEHSTEDTTAGALTEVPHQTGYRNSDQTSDYSANPTWAVVLPTPLLTIDLSFRIPPCLSSATFLSGNTVTAPAVSATSFAL